ncbi:MAG: MFS transporter, partial [Frankiaceae bacterium]
MLLYLSTAGAGVAAVTLLMLCGDLAPALLAPMLGAVADRVELRRLMLACEVGQAMLTAVIAVWLPVVPLLLTLVTIRAVLAQIFQPAARAAV